MVRAIRGAITAKNTRESILESTRMMLKAILAENDLEIDQIIAVTFTCTRDLDAVYPAVAAREIGLVSASLMCMTEMDVQGSLPYCIRVQVLAETDAAPDYINHVYLREARKLRPDLMTD